MVVVLLKSLHTSIFNEVSTDGLSVYCTVSRYDIKKKDFFCFIFRIKTYKMATLKGKTNLDKLKSLCKKTYSEQAKWFLNAFWKAGPKVGEKKEELEQVWTYVMLE